jgi:hypothetical protein
VHRRGIDLDLAVLHIHTINTFRTEKYSRILTLNMYLNGVHTYTKVSRHITFCILGGFLEGS